MDYDEVPLHCCLDLDSDTLSVTFHYIGSRDWLVGTVLRRLRESSHRE